MSILGVGTDVVSIARIEEIYTKFGNKFLYKNFHDLEINDFKKLSENKKIPFLAKRFAGKEAVSKACGVGIGQHISFKDIAIINNELGAPIVKIFDQGTLELKNFNLHISLSDDYPIAVAFAVLESMSK